MEDAALRRAVQAERALLIELLLKIAQRCESLILPRGAIGAPQTRREIHG